MAKNWTAAEAYAALAKGDREDRQDIAKRFPLFATATMEEIIAAIPANVSARKIESILKGEVNDEPADTDDEDNAVESDYSSMSGKELLALCKERGLKVTSHSKDAMIALLEANNDKTVEEDEDEEDEKPVKKTKKAEKPVKKSKKTVEEDEDDFDDFGDDDDDDFDDDDEEEVKPAKKSKKAEKPAKKSKKVEEDDFDDDDDDDDDDFDDFD